MAEQPTSDQVGKRIQNQLQRLRKLEAEQQAAPTAERAREIEVIAEDIRNLDTELRRLAGQ
jgi:hypothetical protein